MSVNRMMKKYKTLFVDKNLPQEVPFSAFRSELQSFIDFISLLHRTCTTDCITTRSGLRTKINPETRIVFL